MFKEIAYYITAAAIATPPAITGMGAAAQTFQSVGSTDIKQFLWPYGEIVYHCEILNKIEDMEIPFGPDFPVDKGYANGIGFQL